MAKQYKDKSTFTKKGFNFSFSFQIKGKPKNFSVYINMLTAKMKTIGYIIVFDDLTAIEKAHRMLAWREVARRIAHEVKNPLTPIKLSAERLQRKYGNNISEPVFKECIDMIKDNVDIIKNLTMEFAAFAKFPSTNLRLDDILPIIKSVTELYEDEFKNIQFEFKEINEIPKINIDAKTNKTSFDKSN